MTIEGARVCLWRAHRLRPPSDADRSGDRRLRYLWFSAPDVLAGSGTRSAPARPASPPEWPERQRHPGRHQ